MENLTPDVLRPQNQGLVSMSRYVSHHPTIGDINSNRYLEVM